MPGKNMSDRERHEAGMKVRRAVLGDAHVDRAEKNKTAFNEPFQDLIRVTPGEKSGRGPGFRGILAA